METWRKKKCYLKLKHSFGLQIAATNWEKKEKNMRVNTDTEYSNNTQNELYIRWNSCGGMRIVIINDDNYYG